MQNSKKDVREVTLAEILDAREKRAILQKKLLFEYRLPLISFTMNIAGPIKKNVLIERAFQYGLAQLYARLPREAVLFKQVCCDPCGCEAMLAVDLDAVAVKGLCVEIEEGSRLGRLFDMDVITPEGDKLERELERSCLVCGKPGRTCAASRAHSAQELFDVTDRIMREHFAHIDAERLGELAAESLIREVEITPKPGLVDLRNSGSHHDMDVNTFRASARALTPYFKNCVKIGIECRKLAPLKGFSALRDAGLRAEKAMYAVTNGVNTHKGLIYSMGVLLGAIGRLWTAENPIPERGSLLAESALLVFESASADLCAASGVTAGEKLYLQSGLKGIRGEVASGFASVVRHSLPAYEAALAQGKSPNDAGVCALIALIAAIEDTNLYHRGGAEGAVFAKKTAAYVLEQDVDLKAVEQMDDAFIYRNLSPGGAADLLAITCFLHSLEEMK